MDAHEISMFGFERVGLHVRRFLPSQSASAQPDAHDKALLAPVLRDRT